MVAAFAQDLPDGIITLHNAPSVQSSTISIVDFGSEVPSFANQLNSKSGALICDRSFCARPYIEARGLTTINGEIYAVERDVTSNKWFLAKFASDYSRERRPEEVDFQTYRRLSGRALS